MWYSSQQQQQGWHGYVHHSSPQHPSSKSNNYSRSSYYNCHPDESFNRKVVTTSYSSRRTEENESLIHYQATRVDDFYVTGPDYYVPTSNESYSDEMSSTSSYPIPWNPVITAPTKISPVEKVLPMTKPSSSSSPPPASACWDWLLYPPEIYSHLYIPSSSFLQPPVQEDEWNLLASLPTWLLALLYPSMKHSICPMDDENESDQEITSLPQHDEKKISSDKSQINRSSTPDTDDGYQSASDASRSDYSQQSSLHYDHSHPLPSILTPKRISYAAAVKPLINPKLHSAPTTPMNKTKNSSCLSNNDALMSTLNGQKSKFIAPRFERMHHAKQHSSSTTMKKDSSPLISNNRPLSRSNNNPNQRQYLINTSRRR